MNDAERLKLLVRALLPFALAAGESVVVLYADDDAPLRILDNSDEPYPTEIEYSEGTLTVSDLHAAMTAIITAGYADALTDTDARAALEGDE